MGLDQYAYLKRPKSAKDYKPKDLEIFYWRKHANLNEYMAQLAVEKGVVSDASNFNCKPLFLTKEDIDKLEAVITSNELPHGEGFFWGVSDERDKARDIEFIKIARALLGDEDNQIYYYCWF